MNDKPNQELKGFTKGIERSRVTLDLAKDPEALQVYWFLKLHATHTPHYLKDGTMLITGQTIFSQQNIVDGTGLTRQKVREAIKRLIKSNLIGRTNKDQLKKASIFTVYSEARPLPGGKAHTQPRFEDAEELEFPDFLEGDGQEEQPRIDEEPGAPGENPENNQDFQPRIGNAKTLDFSNKIDTTGNTQQPRFSTTYNNCFNNKMDSIGLNHGEHEKPGVNNQAEIDEINGILSTLFLAGKMGEAELDAWKRMAKEKGAERTKKEMRGRFPAENI